MTVKTIGENNRLVTYLSPDTGISTALLYGGPKSKLKSLVQPFNTGVLYIYTDEVKKSTKITDFDVKNYHPSLRTDIYKMWAANLAVETVIKTKCAGEYIQAHRLLSGFLDGMELSEEKAAKLGTLRFLWRYICLMGVQPDVEECSTCGQNFVMENTPAHYIEATNGFVCTDCFSSYSQQGPGIEVSMESLNYLNALNRFTPQAVRDLKISQRCYFELKNLLYHLLERSMGMQLNSLKSGMGIL